MTRRDFQLIARTMRDAEARASVRLAMARALATTNPKFDHKRFMRESEPIGYTSAQPPPSGERRKTREESEIGQQEVPATAE